MMVIFIISGCTGKTALTQNTSPMTWDMSKEDELLAYAKIQVKTFESEGYTEVTTGETDSLVSRDKIRVWVNNDAAEKYKDLKEGDSFSVGSTVIRALYDEHSQINKITASVKAAPGQNPDASDWIFVVADADGFINIDESNQWEFGALEACNVCHINQSATDGLFGLP